MQILGVSYYFPVIVTINIKTEIKSIENYYFAGLNR
jgi:hypothetical protein